MHRQAVIGLIGGLSWESSAQYDRIINREVSRAARWRSLRAQPDVVGRLW
jgi:aspartate/glutamate racemase